MAETKNYIRSKHVAHSLHSRPRLTYTLSDLASQSKKERLNLLIERKYALAMVCEL